ncbi:hypothetical protein CCHL11_07281 [Colletotrichum chlorophyti]|uniref:Heterokaryon incompatibility domain-containing protein n=1 Tax=Colletotrichum chlorophyti TaxID=708187 RepID=A0A1Q8RA38_9PEZI|nr:hypothetical protein CCHL11_07281 [Colletotrichum chlorophyti]
MTFCNFCERLDIEQLDQTDVRFHPNLKSLQQSSLLGCPFCALCYARVEEDCHSNVVDTLLNGEVPNGYDKESFYPSIWLHGEIRPANRAVGAGIPGCGLWITCGRLPPDAGLGETNSPGTPIYSRLSAFTALGSPAASKFIERFSTANHDANLHIHLAGWRLRKCKKSHKLCKPRSTGMPTRIIAVGKHDENPRLIATNGLQEPYMALSYCWGPGTDTFNLTHKTKEDLLKGVAQERLTKTHREAIDFARSVGIGYIWIDALCIIQGDADDWAFESQRMAQVYGNAELTLIAGRSSDARLGFIVNDIHQKAQPCAIPLSRSNKDTLSFGIPRSGRMGPVSTRGWCFQEEKLSGRAIIFGEEQLIYQCREERNFEDGKADFQDLHPTFLMPGFSLGREHSAAEKEETLELWYSIVDMFTTRALSNPHDVFAAIASIAKLAKDVLRSRYLAGIWEADLVRGLLWKPRHQVQATFKEPLTRPKPTRFAPAPVIRAPSWSWASVEGPVHQIYNPRKSKLYEGQGYVKVKPKLKTRWTADETCDVSALHMPYCQLQLVGYVAKATIVEGDVMKYLEADKTRRQWLPYTRMMRYATLLASADEGLMGGNVNNVVAVGAFDVPEEAQGCREVWCLLIIDSEGLMIVPDGDKWKRVGWFVLKMKTWFESGREAELRLV